MPTTHKDVLVDPNCQIRLSQNEWLESEALKHNVSKSLVLRDAIDAAMSENR